MNHELFAIPTKKGTFGHRYKKKYNITSYINGKTSIIRKARTRYYIKSTRCKERSMLAKLVPFEPDFKNRNITYNDCTG